MNSCSSFRVCAPCSDCAGGCNENIRVWDVCYNIEDTTSLYLNDNGLEGEIPWVIGNLTNLTELHLYNNQLTGEIPQSLCNLIETNNLDIILILEGNNITNFCD